MKIDVQAHLLDTLHLTAEQHGAYVWILLANYAKGPLPVGALPSIARVSDWEATEKALAPLFAIAGGYWDHPAIAEQRTRAAALSAKRSASGRAGAAAAWGDGGGLANAMANAMANGSCVPLSPTEKDTNKPLTRARAHKGESDRGTCLPEDWALPKDWANWALHEAGGALTRDDVVREGQRFRDHWRGNRNRREGKKADWLATWRNWVRRAIDDKSRGKHGGQTTAGGNVRRSGADVLGDLAGEAFGRTDADQPNGGGGTPEPDS